METTDIVIFKFQEQTLVRNSIECLWEIQYQEVKLVYVINWACQVFCGVNELCLTWTITPETILMIN